MATAEPAGPTSASPPPSTARSYTARPTATAMPPSGPGSCCSPATPGRAGGQSGSDPGHRVTSAFYGDAELAGQVRGQRHQLNAVDGGAAQRVESGRDAQRSTAQVYLLAGRLREVRAGQGAPGEADPLQGGAAEVRDRKSTRLNSSHVRISYAV